MIEQSKHFAYSGENIGQVSSGPRRFPQGFKWGSATADYQVRKHPIERDSDEGRTNFDAFIERKKVILPGEHGLDHWASGNAERDFQAMKDLGLNAQRLGFEWARIEPEQGKIDQKAIGRYRQMIDFLKKNDMEPMVTVNHFILPKWVGDQGGWENKKIREWIKRYAEVIADNFPDVPYWVTINEPNVLTGAGWIEAYWPPEKKGLSGILTAFCSVAPNMVAAHNLIGNELTKQTGSGKIGIANAITWFKPEHENSKLDKIPGKLADMVYNYKFLNSTIHNSDFVGINFYTGYRLKFKAGLGAGVQKEYPKAIGDLPFGKTVRHNEEQVSDIGWPIVPESFLEALQHISSKYKKPVMITENGVQDKEDKVRSFYILTHLIALHEAIKRGVEIRRYDHWTTVDNLEWSEGFDLRLGLIARDPKTGETKIRESAKLYGEIATTNGIDAIKLEKYLTPEQRDLTKKFLQSLG